VLFANLRVAPSPGRLVVSCVDGKAREADRCLRGEPLGLCGPRLGPGWNVPARFRIPDTNPQKLRDVQRLSRRGVCVLLLCAPVFWVRRIVAGRIGSLLMCSSAGRSLSRFRVASAGDGFDELKYPPGFLPADAAFEGVVVLLLPVLAELFEEFGGELVGVGHCAPPVFCSSRSTRRARSKWSSLSGSM
jgi:hypothetical protein